MSDSNFIVSTDLDGTLLDHHTYEWQDAAPAIERLISLNIPIIFNTSKTFDEAFTLQKEIGISAPIIVENGSAIALDSNTHEKITKVKKREFKKVGSHWFEKYGEDRENILRFILEQKKQHGYKLEGFNDWTTEEVASHTNLTYQAAKLSQNKRYSEPFIWHSTSEEFSIFKNAASKSGLTILQGGRFFHLQGNTNKAIPIKQFQSYYTEATGHKHTLICLGDNQNDLHMLNVADIPICVKSPTSPFPDIEENENAIYTKELGPKGWNNAVLEILEAHI